MSIVKRLLGAAWFYIKENSTFRWLVIPLILFGAFAIVLPAPDLIKYLSWVLAVTAFMVFVTYLGAVWTGLTTNGPMPRYTHLALGIALGWLSIVMNRTWVGMIRAYPLEMWMRDSYFIAFYVWTSIMAGVFHMTAPGAIDGVVPQENWIKIGISVTIGILLGVVATIIVTSIGAVSGSFQMEDILFFVSPS